MWIYYSHCCFCWSIFVTYSIHLCPYYWLFIVRYRAARAKSRSSINFASLMAAFTNSSGRLKPCRSSSWQKRFAERHCFRCKMQKRILDDFKWVDDDPRIMIITIIIKIMMIIVNVGLVFGWLVSIPTQLHSAPLHGAFSWSMLDIKSAAAKACLRKRMMWNIPSPTRTTKY